MITLERVGKEEWVDIFGKSEQVTIFHRWEWLKIVEKHTGFKFIPLVAFKGSKPIALYPIFLKHKLAFSPPPKSLLLYLGPAFVDYSNLKQSKRETMHHEVQKCVDEYLKESGCVFFRVRTIPELPDCRPLKWNGYEIDPLYTYRIDLKGGLNSVWKNLNRKLRVGIEATRKRGIKIDMGDYDDLRELRRLLHGRFVEQGLSKRDRYEGYLKDLYSSFQENMRIFVARMNGEVVGGLVVLSHRNWSGLWIGIPKINIKGVYPNDLAQWMAITWACEEGYEIYEEMDAGLERFRHFKAKYNPKAVPWFSGERFYGLLGRLLRVFRR